MRLWHIDLLSFLPRSQLLAQWRELNSIYKKQDKHILINYIYDYEKEYLHYYSQSVINEMQKRGYKINKWDNFDKYFKGVKLLNELLVYTEHDDQYLLQCFYNLQEKYNRGQKDFNVELYERLCGLMGNKNLAIYR